MSDVASKVLLRAAHGRQCTYSIHAAWLARFMEFARCASCVGVRGRPKPDVSSLDDTSHLCLHLACAIVDAAGPASAPSGDALSPGLATREQCAVGYRHVTVEYTFSRVAAVGCCRSRGL